MFEKNKWYKSTLHNSDYYIKVIDFEKRQTYQNTYEYHVLYYNEKIQFGEYIKLNVTGYWANKEMEQSALENIVTSEELFQFLPDDHPDKIKIVEDLTPLIKLLNDINNE